MKHIPIISILTTGKKISVGQKISVLQGFLNVQISINMLFTYRNDMFNMYYRFIVPTSPRVSPERTEAKLK